MVRGLLGLLPGLSARFVDTKSAPLLEGRSAMRPWERARTWEYESLAVL